MRSKINWPVLCESLRQTAVTTGVLFLIIIAGLLFSRMLLVNGFIPSLTDLVQQLGLTPARFILITVLLFLVLGMFVDTISMMVMTIPFLYPIAKTIGIDGIWFGVILVKLVEIAAISPPVGLNLYAVLSSCNGTVKSRELFKGVAPFLLFEGVTLGHHLT